MSIKGSLHSVETFGTLDGPGIRYVLFLQGCALRCLYCHNPDTWKMGAGKEVDSQEVVNEILTYKNFIRKGGVTLSGGEPLLQPEFALDVIQRCREHGIHTAVDTAGSVSLLRSAPVLEASDLVLLDIKSLKDSQCISLTGKSNSNTLATLDYCEHIGKPVWLRHVLVPGWTLEMSQLKELAEFLKPYQCIQKIELLPFHKMGEYKWKAMKLQYQLENIKEPTDEELTQAKVLFAKASLPVPVVLPESSVLHSA